MSESFDKIKELIKEDEELSNKIVQLLDGLPLYRIEGVLKKVEKSIKLVPINTKNSSK